MRIATAMSRCTGERRNCCGFAARPGIRATLRTRHARCPACFRPPWWGRPTPRPAFGAGPIAFLQTAGAFDAAGLIEALRDMTCHDVSKLRLRALDAMPVTLLTKVTRTIRSKLITGC